MPVAVYRICRVALTLYLALSLAGCAATVTAKLPLEIPAKHNVNEFIDDEQVVDIADPWEGFNRRIYIFNYNFDKYVFLPFVSGYEFITPAFVQKGVTNFFGNIEEIQIIYNSLFQLKGRKLLKGFSRFLVNSTIGIAGLFDPAGYWGLKKEKEDFGRTLGYWGVHSGPYLVLPVFGPNTLRSAGGFTVDAGIRFAFVNTVDPFKGVHNGNTIEAGITTLEGIDVRHREQFRYYDSGYPFEYEIIRFLYHKKSELLLMK